MVSAQLRMDLLTLFIYFCARVVMPCCGFTLDAEQPIIFQEAAKGFGQSVVHFGAGTDAGMLVSAPLQRENVNETGKLYKCQPMASKSSGCQEVILQKPPDAINMSLGMSLSASNSQVMACGPTVHQTCGNNIYLKGYCFLLDQTLSQTLQLPKSLPECPKLPTDIALLIDGSGSIKRHEFSQMKTFIIEVMMRFLDNNTQFALSQYSGTYQEHFDFLRFKKNPNPNRLLQPVRQLYGATHTATYIQKVVREIFRPEKGARREARKILIVITDGEKSGDPLEYIQVIPEAEKAGIIRFAIGVGTSFSTGSAKQELDTIASKPSSDHVFPVDNFDALKDIQNQLQDKIFAIEGVKGTESEKSSSFQLEMSQEGFSALLTPDGPVLGAVGAYDWSGGSFLYHSHGDPIFINVSSSKEMKDAYMGYSMQMVQLKGQKSFVVGAPRYQHVGRVFMFSEQNQKWQLKSELSSKKLSQIGSYFGATLCSVDLNQDSNTDLILIGAPMYYDGVAGGRVYICQRQGDTFSCEKELQGEAKQPLGRFGASIAAIGDITGDTRTDVAIGAPMENENQGAVYIFRGTSRSLQETYSQRIHSLPPANRLQYFGQAIGAGMDLTDDGLPDVAVGTQGKVLLLRSRPVIQILPRITFNPPLIPTSAFECRDQSELNKEVSKATVCLTAQADPRFKQGDSISNTIKYTLSLDPGRLKVRAAFREGQGTSVITGEIKMGLTRECKDFHIKLPKCIEDSLTPINLRLNYTLRGEPILPANNLRAILNEDDSKPFIASLPFQKDCGTDDICKDKLKASFNFSGLNTVVVGMTTELNLTVFIQNDGEDSYSTTVTFSHPPALSFRRVTVLRSNRRFVAIKCACPPATEENPQTNTTFNINHPIFRAGAQVTFLATFSISQDADFGSLIQVNSTAGSENNVPITQDMIHQAQLPVKYAVYIFVNTLDESTKYVNFSTNTEDGNQIVEHRYEVKNIFKRKVPVSVTFQFPVKLDGISVWDASLDPLPESVPFVQCTPEKETSGSKDFVNQLRQDPILTCSVAACKTIRCNIPLLDLVKPLMFTIKGRMNFKWVSQTQQKKVTLMSTARISYDENKYTQKEGLVQAKAQTVVEHLQPYNYLPVIVGSSIGGLILLALLTAGLYKAGFFKRQYKQMMDTAEPGGAEGAGPPPDSTVGPETSATKV